MKQSITIILILIVLFFVNLSVQKALTKFKTSSINTVVTALQLTTER